MENPNINEFNELDDIRQQINAIKDKVDQQGHLNVALVKQTIRSKMKSVHRTSMSLAVTAMFCIPLYIWMKYEENLSWGLTIATIVLMTGSIIADYFINRIDVSHMGDDMVETARKLTRMKINRSKELRIGIIAALLWLVWMLYEFYNSHLAEGATAAWISIVPLIVGAILGAILGIFIFHKMQRANDEMIRQINDITRDQ